MKILLTAFEGFDGRDLNASKEALKDVAEKIDGHDIHKLFVPVSFSRSAALVLDEIEKYHPDAVLLLGEAAGRKELTPERIAINCDDARIQDNDGNEPHDQKIIEDGPAAFFSRLPIKKMVEYMKNENVEASLSNTAGTFVCNHLMYEVLYHLERKHPEMIAGFMHVPLMHEQIKEGMSYPSLSRQEIVKGVEASLKAIIDTLSE